MNDHPCGASRGAWAIYYKVLHLSTCPALKLRTTYRRQAREHYKCTTLGQLLCRFTYLTTLNAFLRPSLGHPQIAEASHHHINGSERGAPVSDVGVLLL